jgi:NADPH:quinone reductase-like Zn-dependent oxidoreductase
MHNIWITRCFQLQEVETPIPKDHEVRIKIYVASVGPSDCTFRKGSLIVKLVYWLRRPKNPIFGTELSGIIDAVGKKVTRYKVGDQVFGLSAKTFGAQTEYKCLHVNTLLAIKPAAMSYEEAVGTYRIDVPSR